MDDVDHLLKVGRSLLRERPALTEAEFRSLMLERFQANDQGRQQDTANMTVGGEPGPAGGVFALFALPWVLFRWLGWRGRCAAPCRHGRNRADAAQGRILCAGRELIWLAPTDFFGNRGFSPTRRLNG